MIEKSVSEIVLKLEQDYISGVGTLMSEHVRYDLYTDINTIYAYLNSKHISGEKDSLGRDKPFANIVLAARNIWFRATDIDRKDINMTATKAEDIVAIFLLNVFLQNWMKKKKFGKFLNNWGLELAGFNEAVVKIIEKDDELDIAVTPWSRLICDQVNFADNPKIEILELTEAQMYERYDKEKVDAIVNAETTRQLLDKRQKDNKSDYYKLYELHGVFSLKHLTGKESDAETFVQQMHVLSFVSNGKGKTKDEIEYSLYSGREEYDPYMLTSLIPSTDGSISLEGSVKNLFEAQWMMNHSVKSIKDQLDLASKLIFQTSDGNFVGQNALFAIESGDILIHQMNQPLTQLNNNSHDITSLQNFGQQWKSLGNEIVGVSEAMLGAQPKSGTAWRQTEALLQENHSLFEIMTETKGLFLEDMLRDRIIPFLIKKGSNSNQVSTTLNSFDIKKIDGKYLPFEARKRMSKKLIDEIIETGEIPQDLQEREDAERDGVQEELTDMGTKRFFTPDQVGKLTWKELFKGLEFDCDIDITGEGKDVQAMYATLNTALQVVNNPGFEQNPRAKLIVDKILTASGHISPLELSSIPDMATQIQPQTLSAPNGGQVDERLEALQTNQQQ